MKLTVIAGSILLAVGLTGCGTNAKQVEASIASARSTIEKIAEKREETKKEAEKSVQGKWTAAVACAGKDDAGKIAVCMLGLAAMDKSGAQVAAAEPLPSIPVLTPQPSLLEKSVNVAAAFSPLVAQGLNAWATIKVAENNKEVQLNANEFNFKTEQARGDTTVKVVEALTKVPSINVNGDYLTGGSNKAGGDLANAGGTITAKNCTAGNAGTAAGGTVTGSGATLVTVPPAPGGHLTLGC